MNHTGPDSNDHEDEEPVHPIPFGDTSLGAGLGCTAVILAAGLAIAAILWVL